jgi:ribonuclease H / adenosylcobalamin/alpha-ribazole phosphatase
VRLTLIRHGETEEPRPGLAEIGHADPDLSASGRRQAEALARELAATAGRGESIVAVYSSPLLAARSTTEILTAGLGVETLETYDELVTLTPEVVPAEGGIEALSLLQERAWSLVEALKERHEETATLVLVSHELTIRALVCHMLEAPLQEMWRFALEPASITTLEFRGQRRLLALLNETCHLEDEARTR